MQYQSSQQTHLVVALLGLGNMLQNIDVSKRTLQDRMKTVNDSFDVQTPFPTNASSHGPTNMFRISRHFSRRSRLNQSQEHLAAYKIGKLIQRDEKLFSPDIVYRNVKRYYQGLISKSNICMRRFLFKVYVFIASHFRKAKVLLSLPTTRLCLF